jgi:hypothetical protein
MADEGRRFLRRAIASEEQLESCRERNRELESLIKAMVRATADPMLLKVIGECDGLLSEVMTFDHLSRDPSWRTRTAAQLHVVSVIRRGVGESE